jgi:hydroxymethylpyrimidine/phosphomethylpyrimidine kinase
MKGRVLIVAGSDSSGGAGIQADIKTVTMLGGYAATAITALTAQNSLAVTGILPVAPEFVRQQMDAVLDDIGADCVKTGMLHDAGVVAAVADGLEAAAPDVPLVVDPVMLATSGARLLDAAALDMLKRRLIARARVLTPNLPEAEELLGRRIAGMAEMAEAAAALRQLGPAVVVIKGGHLPGASVRDVVDEEGARYVLESARIETRHTHGTGCTFASAIATGIAQGMAMRAAIERAHAFVQQAIANAPGFGGGHGPLGHG